MATAEFFFPQFTSNAKQSSIQAVVCSFRVTFNSGLQ